MGWSKYHALFFRVKDIDLDLFPNTQKRKKLEHEVAYSPLNTPLIQICKPTQTDDLNIDQSPKH